ncbi:tetratricopeptide repeat protein [Granulicella sp. 5B5]|uniref:tetratricopeptide repeat protein n=1 Tax=Granulicella sp. 5B5 TaxID=1617967 RepID=UPI0015F6C282|nr:cytochrome c [Granulicella sp. 5B5]QMV18943.1 tetratricopeptide repeat protein [Granulicella sp. 5B5]
MNARLLLALLLAAPLAAQQPATTLTPREHDLITWRGQIAPIVYKNCTACHHTGGSAPFDLTTYAQAKRWAPQMLDVTQSRYMPPWLPAPGHGNFADNRRMSDAEVAAIKQWVLAGSPEGSGHAPAAPVYSSEWTLGPPDLVLTMSTPLHVPASGQDLYMNVILPTGITQRRWVRAMEIKPGDTNVVHHANLILDRTESLRRQHPATWQQGIPGMDIMVDSGDDFDPDSHFLFWKPDSTALVEPPTMPWRLDPGDDLVLNLHLKPTGKPETVRARIALYFTDKPATQHPMLLQLEDDADLNIPPNDPDFVVQDYLKLPVAVSVLGIYPHAHYLGKRLEGWAELPDGTRRDLILIPSWDIDRQSVYRLAAPLHLPAGTVLHMRYTYDNTAANIHNPNSPPIRVKAGNRSVDEMAHLWLQVLPDPPAEGQPDPRLALERAWMENRLRKSPDDAIALYNMAALETAEGNNTQAKVLYRRLLAQRPDDVRTMTSLAAATAAAGDWQSAQQQLRTAIAQDPTYTDASFDLAALDLQHAETQPNKLAEAEHLLTTITTAHPADAQSQRLLALTYATEGLLAKAVDHLQAWQKLAPMDPEPHRALAQVYAQMGQQPDAIREQKAAVALDPATGQQAASDWSDLGVMEAELGNRTAAKLDFQRALQLDPTLEAARNNLSKL